MTTIANRLLEACQEAPEQPALHLLYASQPDQTITHRQLYHAAAGYARALANVGVQPGQVVILILHHGEDLVYAFFGAILQGAIPAIMPFLSEKLDAGKYRQSLAALFQVTAPGAVVTFAGFEQEARAAGADVILLSGSQAAGETPDPASLPGLQSSPDAVALLQHSSGTTGLQKGVALSHQAVFNQLESYGRALVLQPDDVVVSWLPLYHDMGLIAGFLLPILNRLPLVLLSPFDWVRAPQRLLQAVSRYRGTLSWLPNFAYNFCAQKMRARDLVGVDLSSWRVVTNCSEPVYWQSHQMFLERFAPYGLRPSALATSYAMAENVFAVTQGGVQTPLNVDCIDRDALLTRQTAQPAAGGDASIQMLSCGRPIEHTRLRVLDAHGRDLPERMIGEIALQSNCMLTGYYQRADLSAAAFLDGWYLTGDLGYQAGGELYITGRKKDLIIVGGKNIHPQDLERLAGEAPGVHPGRVVAFGVFSEQGGTEEVVIVAESDDENADARYQIGDDIRQRVTRGSDIALRHVAVVGRDWLLKTSSGKIARSANREKYLLWNAEAEGADHG